LGGLKGCGFTQYSFVPSLGEGEGLIGRFGNGNQGEYGGRHHALVRGELARFHGREINTAGDSFLATFESPAWGIQCACAISESVRKLGMEIRAGLHLGECEVVEDLVSGIAMHIGARVSGMAGAGEVLVSSTVRDALAGSDIRFEDHGTHLLKGIPGEWRLFVLEEAV